MNYYEYHYNNCASDAELLEKNIEEFVYNNPISENIIDFIKKESEIFLHKYDVDCYVSSSYNESLQRIKDIIEDRKSINDSPYIRSAIIDEIATTVISLCEIIYLTKHGLDND